MAIETGPVDTDEPVSFVRNKRPKGETLVSILSRDRELRSNDVEFWRREQYVVSSLPGWHGQDVIVSASITRSGRDMLILNMTVVGHIFQVPGLWSPLDALAWFGLPEDTASWRRDPEEERRFSEGEQVRKNGIVIPRSQTPIAVRD